MKLRAFVIKNLTWVSAGIIVCIWKLVPSYHLLSSDSNVKSDLLLFLIRVYSTIHLYFKILCLVMLPIKTIILISKGVPFNTSNIKNLHAIAYFLFLNYLAGVLFRLHIRYTANVNNTFYEHHKDLDPKVYFSLHLEYIIGGILVFIIAKAFKRGYNLQKEQELTI